MKSPFYILDGNHDIVPIDDTEAFSEWFGKTDRHIDRTNVGEYFVSTVFLGIYHNYDPAGLPLLFETMVFGGKGDEDDEYTGQVWRYSTYEEARQGHNEVMRLIEEAK